MEIVKHIEIRDGKGYLKDTGIKADLVASMYVWEHGSIEAIAEHYHITRADVHAAIAFYYDNEAEIDADYQTTMDWLKENATSAPEFREMIEARKHSKR